MSLTGPFFQNPHPMTGTVDGVNKTFTFPSTPPANVAMTVGGLLFAPGASADYTISGNTCTFAVAPTQQPVAYY